MTHYASFNAKSGPMHDDTIAAKVIEMIQGFYPNGVGQVDAAKLVEEKCGRFVRGKNKGKLRGWATWEFCSRGGWHRRHPGDYGHVVYPGAVMKVEIKPYLGEPYLSVER